VSPFDVKITRAIEESKTPFGVDSRPVSTNQNVLRGVNGTVINWGGEVDFIATVLSLLNNIQIISRILHRHFM